MGNRRQRRMLSLVNPRLGFTLLASLVCGAHALAGLYNTRDTVRGSGSGV